MPRISDTNLIKCHHVCVSGFLQDEGGRHGLSHVWRELRQKYASPTTDVLLKRWDSSWREVALRIRDCSIPDPVICVYGYSWGGGHGAKTLAHHLQRLELRVKVAVLSDPVYRSATFFGRWMALWPWARIHIPANVDRVVWFRQFHDWPRGHDLVAMGNNTRIIPPNGSPAPEGVGHCQMDELRAFQAACFQEAADAMTAGGLL